MRRDAFHWSQNKGERRLRLIERRHMAVAGHSQLDHRDFRYWHIATILECLLFGRYQGRSRHWANRTQQVRFMSTRPRL